MGGGGSKPVSFNPIDYINEGIEKGKKEMEKFLIKEFEKKVKKKVIAISTLDKKLISFIKSKLVKHVS